MSSGERRPAAAGLTSGTLQPRSTQPALKATGRACPRCCGPVSCGGHGEGTHPHDCPSLAGFSAVPFDTCHLTLVRDRDGRSGSSAEAAALEARRTEGAPAFRRPSPPRLLLHLLATLTQPPTLQQPLVDHASRSHLCAILACGLSEQEYNDRGIESLGCAGRTPRCTRRPRLARPRPSRRW